MRGIASIVLLPAASPPNVPPSHSSSPPNSHPHSLSDDDQVFMIPVLGRYISQPAGGPVFGFTLSACTPQPPIHRCCKPSVSDHPAFFDMKLALQPEATSQHSQLQLLVIPALAASDSDNLVLSSHWGLAHDELELELGEPKESKVSKESKECKESEESKESTEPLVRSNLGITSKQLAGSSPAVFSNPAMTRDEYISKHVPRDARTLVDASLHFECSRLLSGPLALSHITRYFPKLASQIRSSSSDPALAEDSCDAVVLLGEMEMDLEQPVPGVFTDAIR